MTTLQLRKIMAELRRELPTDRPVRVVRRPLGTSLYGYTSRGRRRYTIVISTRLSAVRQREILMHEYAHALAWREQDRRKWTESHDMKFWGAAFARVWSVFDEESP